MAKPLNSEKADALLYKLQHDDTLTSKDKRVHVVEAAKLIGLHALADKIEEYSIKSPDEVELARLEEETKKLAAIQSHKLRNVGSSDYATHTTQPWDIWREYDLNPWDADIVKRVLRTKEGDSRRLDYQKIIHVCEERIAQLDGAYD